MELWSAILEPAEFSLLIHIFPLGNKVYQTLLLQIKGVDLIKSTLNNCNEIAFLVLKWKWISYIWAEMNVMISISKQRYIASVKPNLRVLSAFPRNATGSALCIFPE